ncbi:MAG: hypothetical protein ACRDJO_02060, partial [Actinomycetota bacterium]
MIPVLKKLAAIAILTLVVLSGTALPPTPAAAAPESGIVARLLDFPSWVAPADTLRAVLQVENPGGEPVGELQARLSVFTSTNTRTELGAALDGRRRGGNTLLDLDTIEIEPPLVPGESRTVVLEKALSQVSSLRREGVYPVTIAVAGKGAVAPPIVVPLLSTQGPAALPLGV